MGRAGGGGAPPGERGHIAQSLSGGPRGCLGIGGPAARPPERGEPAGGLGKGEPALRGKTPAAFMSPTIAQYHTGFLESRATGGMPG